jgi:hypothetical protein
MHPEAETPTHEHCAAVAQAVITHHDEEPGR